MTKERPDDGELIARAERGEKEAFDLLVERWFSTVVSVVYGLTGEVESAREIAQETFLDAVGRLSDLRVPGKFGPWLCGIAKHKAASVLRRRRIERTALKVRRDTAFPDPPETPPQAALRRERGADVRRAVAALPPHYREVIVLRFVDGRSYEEIAALLGLSPAAVDKRLTRAKELLRGTMRRELASED